MMKKKAAVLGSTGSVGTQVLDVCDKLGADVAFIAARSNIELLLKQIKKFKPEYVAVTDTDAADKLKSQISGDTKLIKGYDATCRAIEEFDCDIVFNAVSGKNGLLPTLSVIRSGKTLALANKESMVLAGPIVNAEAKKHNATILPVDSEHCAIFQCLKNGKKSEVKRILLTASGGPFFGYTYGQLERVSLEETMKHPTWNMGKKITVDSATLANKGLEIIEAMHLFDVPYDKIKVLIHRQSIVHSMVEYNDNSVIAQLAVPDMRHPGQYALTYPDRVDGVINELDLTKYTLTFNEPDEEAFKMLPLARFCAKAGGIMPCVYNAANEAAVDLFLKKSIGFNDIYRICEYVISSTDNAPLSDIEQIIEEDKKARELAYSYKEKLNHK